MIAAGSRRLATRNRAAQRIAVGSRRLAISWNRAAVDVPGASSWLCSKWVCLPAAHRRNATQRHLMLLLLLLLSQPRLLLMLLWCCWTLRFESPATNLPATWCW